MRDRPNGSELMALASECGADVSLVRLAQDIAAREAVAGDAPLRTEHERLAALYGDIVDPAETLQAALLRLNACFAIDLRAGQFDRPGPRRDAAIQLLRERAFARLAEDNPAYDLAD